MAKHRNTLPPKKPTLSKLAPVRPRDGWEKPWEGRLEVKPWDYQVAVALPHLDTPQMLPIILDAYALQTVKPFVMILDTGSLDEHYESLLSIAEQYDNVEVHQIRLAGVPHPSDPVAMAMDLAMTLCRSPYLFCSHTDVFPRRRDLLEWMIDLADVYKIVGYEITPRAGIAWEGMVSHTATMIEIDWADQIGLGWSQRRLCNLVGAPWRGPEASTGSFPDTEVCMNYIMRAIGKAPHLVGKEENYKRTLDDNIDHVRSFPSSKQYSDDHHQKAQAWMVEAVTEAIARNKTWKAEVSP